MKVDPANLIGDPLYQCNLLLWMLQPSTGVTVKPLLKQAGYTLRYIEPKLPLTLPLANKLKADALPTAEHAEPELIVQNTCNDYVILECKRSMFGYRSGQDDRSIRQCRAFLLQVPQVFSEALPGIKPKEIASTHLIYLSRHNLQEQQFTGVQAIGQELTSKNYHAVPHGLLTLDISGGNIGIHKSETHGVLPDPLAQVLTTSFTSLQEIPDAETDPRPLYYMPWMPDCASEADEYSQNSFANRIFGGAAAEIGVAQPPCDVELEIEPLLNRATNDFYGFWRNKDSQKHVRKHVLSLLNKEIIKADGKAVLKKLDVPRTGWKVSLADIKMQSHIVEHFRKWQYEVWLKPEMPDLFPNY